MLIVSAYVINKTLVIDSNEKHREVFRFSKKFRCFFFLFKNMDETNNFLLAYANEKFLFNFLLAYAIIKL